MDAVTLVRQNQLGTKKSVVIGKCDRALEWNARGTAFERYKKSATTASHRFFALARASTAKPHAHCPVAARRWKGPLYSVNQERELVYS